MNFATPKQIADAKARLAAQPVTTWTDEQEAKLRELLQLLKEAVSVHTKRAVQSQLHKLLQAKMASKAEQTKTTN